MADGMKGRFEWLDEAFDRGYQMGKAHGSKNSGLTWITDNTVQPDSGTEVIIAVARSEKSKRKKLQGHEAYGMLTGRFFNEQDAVAEGCFMLFRGPQSVVTLDETNRFILWSEVLAWAYLNAPEIGESKGEA